MDTLYSTNSSPVLDTKKSDRLYFNKYQYCLNFHLSRAGCLRNLAKDDVHDLEFLVTQRFVRQTRWGWLGPSATYRDDISTEAYKQRVLDDLITAARILHPHLELMRMIVSGHYVYLYSNNLDTLQELTKIPQFSVCAKLCQIEIDRPANTILLHNSLYLKRSYFRERWIDASRKEALQNFLTRQDDIRLGPALKSCLNGKNISYKGETLLQRYFFFDHNSDSTAVMLELVAPGTIRRTVPVLTK